MRLTLEQLKGMSLKQLGKHWTKYQFPFDKIPGGQCSGCLLMHEPHSFIERIFTRLICWNPQHKKINGMLPSRNGRGLQEYLHENLEELYALRLFCEMQPVPETPAEVKESASERQPVQTLEA